MHLLNGIAIVAFIGVPLVAGVALLGPLRNKEVRTALIMYGWIASAALVIAATTALNYPDNRGPLFLGLLALLLGPVSGLFIALRLEVVRNDRRAAFVFGPLGYLAGCGVALRIMVSLGFGF